MWENLPLLGDHNEDEQTPQQAAQPNLYVSRDINPDIRAKALQIAPQFNLPVETVEAELPKYEQEAAFQSFTLDDYADFPVTMRGLSHPQEAPLYRDDAENLSAWEKLMQDIGRASAAGKRTVEQKDIWWRKYTGTATGDDEARDKQLDAAARIDAARPKNYDGWVTGIPKAIVEMAPLWLDSVARSADETAMGASIGAAATSWSGAGAAAGAGAGLMSGLAWGTIKEMTEAETALAYKEFSQLRDASGKPVDDAAARGAAALVGVANGAVEAFGGKVLAKATPVGRIVGMFGRERIADLMKIPSARKAFAAVGRTLGVGAAVGGFEEAWQEANNVIIGEQMVAAFNSSIAPLILSSNEQATQRIGEAGKMGAQAGIAFAAPEASLGAMLDASTSRALSRNASMVQEIAGLVEGSKTFQRMPQKWQEHIRAIKEEYGVAHDVTVPLGVLQTYFQEAGIAADQLAKELPGTAASLAQAAKTGQDVAIPVEEFAATFARSPEFAKHIPDVRMHPQLPTDREAAEIRTHLKEMVQNIPVKSQPVFDDIRAKVAAAESPAVADFQAAVHYAFYQTQADALGVPVEEFYKQFKVDIERQGITGPSTADLVSMIQADAVPTDAEVFGPSLQEFVSQYGDSATTREEAIARGYFDTTDPADITEAQWAQAIADTDPRYAYGAADLTKLDVQRRVKALESWAGQMGVDLKHKIKNRRGIDSDQDIAISKMLADLKSSESAGAIVDGVGNDSSVIGGFASTTPEWFKAKTVKAFDKKHSTNYAPHITKKNILGAWEKKNAGQDLNAGEFAAWQYLKIVADEEMQTDAGIVQEITFNSLEKEGFVFDAPSMLAVGYLSPGDEIVVMGDNGVPDKLTHSGFNEKGEAVLKGIKTVYADPWDSVEVIARKVPADAQGIANLLEKGGYQQGGTGEAFKPVDTNSANFKEWFGDSVVTEDGKAGGKPLRVYHGSKWGFDGKAEEGKAYIGAMFLTDSMENADLWSKGFTPTADDGSFEDNKVDAAAQVVEAYVSMSNPITDETTLEDVLGSEEEAEQYREDFSVVRDPFPFTASMDDGSDLSILAHRAALSPTFLAYLKKRGYDGWAYWDEETGGTTYIPFSPTQIKSAISNTGAFSKTDPRIQYQGEQDPRGYITMNRARDYFKITLTGRADLSTFLHESGHMFLEMMNQLSSQPNAPERIVADMLVIRQWLGMKPGEEFTREHHEQWARGFEAYLMEGKAPSAELKSAFARFKAWLTAVYKDVKALAVPLTDEVRGVMDRMFASQEAINRTAELDRLTPIFGADKLDMTEEEYGEYMLAFSAGMAEAEEGLFQRLVREMTAHKQAQHKDATRQIRAEVTKDVEGRPVYQAIHYLTTGKLMDGTTPPGGILGKLDRAAIKRRFPDAKFGGMLGRVSMKDGADPSMVAKFFGFKTGDELIKAIAEAPKMAEAIKAETQERFKAIFGDSMSDPGAIAKQAREALHNDRLGDMIVKELHVLNRTIKRVVPVGYIRAMQIFADEQIGATSIGKLQPHVFQVAEQRYARAAFDAAAKNDWLAAADAKRLQLMNHWLFRKATAAREEVDGIRNYLRKFERVETRKKLGLAGGHYLESVDALLSGVGLTNVSAKQIGRRNSLRAYLERMEADGQTVAIPDSLREEAFLKNYKSMNVEEFRALRDAVKNLDHLARLKNKLQAGAEERDFRKTMVEIVNGITSRAKEIRAMRKQNPTFWEAGAAKLRSIDAQLSKVEFLVRQLDGGIAGKLHEILFAPIADAQAKKFDMVKEFNRKLYDPLRKLPKEQKARLAAEYDFLGVPMRGHEVLAVALNMGNESNLKKLIEGYEDRGYTEERLQNAVDDILTAEDWQLVQHIWDQVNSLWPEIARVQKAATGLEPKKVEPRKVMSKHGVFDGGYYPIFFDRNRNYKAMVDAQRSNSLFETNYMSPKVGHGFTEERTAYAGPLMLSLDGLPRHINDVIHFLTHYDAVTQALKVISDQDFRVAVSQTVGAEYYAELKPWLQAVANEGKSDLLADFTDRFANHVSTGMSIMTMGFSLSTGLIQILGLSSSLSELGPRYLVHGLRGMLDPEARKLAFEKSNELRHTIQTFDRDARAAYSQMLAMISGDVAGKAKYAHAQMVNFAFAVMGYVQREVNIATWLGAYAKADAEGVENPAMAADSVMRMTQSGGGIKDMARIQRPDKPMRRLFTAFYTYFSVLYGQLKAAGQRLPSEPWVAMAQFATLVLLPPLVEQLLKRGLPDDDDDPEKWMKAYLSGVASFGVATLPIVRDFVQAAIGDRSYGFTPVAQIIESGLAAAKAAATGDDLSESQIKALARAFGIATHLPANQIIKTATYFDALLDGEVEEPIREFLFGKVKK